MAWDSVGSAQFIRLIFWCWLLSKQMGCCVSISQHIESACKSPTHIIKWNMYSVWEKKWSRVIQHSINMSARLKLVSPLAVCFTNKYPHAKLVILPLSGPYLALCINLWSEGSAVGGIIVKLAFMYLIQFACWLSVSTVSIWYN